MNFEKELTTKWVFILYEAHAHIKYNLPIEQLNDVYVLPLPMIMNVHLKFDDSFVYFDSFAVNSLRQEYLN